MLGFALERSPYSQDSLNQNLIYINFPHKLIQWPELLAAREREDLVLPCHRAAGESPARRHKREELRHATSPARPVPDLLIAMAIREAPRNRTDKLLWGEMAPSTGILVVR